MLFWKHKSIRGVAGLIIFYLMYEIVINFDVAYFCPQWKLFIDAKLKLKHVISLSM